MKHLAAYLLLALGGKESPSAEDVKGLLNKLDVGAEDEKVEQLLKAMEGKNLDEVLEAGEKKLLSVGGSGGGVAAAGAAPAAGAAAEKKEEKKPEKKEEAAEVDASAGNLFGGSGGKY